jgi:hypothetical protein
VVHPATVSDAARANKVTLIKDDFMQFSFFRASSRRASERRMNPFTVRWFSVEGAIPRFPARPAAW